MRPGQRAVIHVDSLDRDFQGSVETIGGSTGAVASTIPPENATGNYVKVVQRIPVRIALDAYQDQADRLRPGMSLKLHDLHSPRKVGYNVKFPGASDVKNARNAPMASRPMCDGCILCRSRRFCLKNCIKGTRAK